MPPQSFSICNKKSLLITLGEQTNLAIYPLEEKEENESREYLSNFSRYRIPRCKRTYFTFHQQIQPRLLTMVVNNWKLVFGNGTYRCISRFVSPFILLFLFVLFLPNRLLLSRFSVPKHLWIYGKGHGPFNRETVGFLVLDKRKHVELSTRRVSFNERNGKTICNSARFRLKLAFRIRFFFFFFPERDEINSKRSSSVCFRPG